MGSSPILAPVQIESVVFPTTVKPPVLPRPSSSAAQVRYFAPPLILASVRNMRLTYDAGFAIVRRLRGVEIQGKFVKVTAIGVYLEDDAVPLLAVKWKGKTAQELTDSVEFFSDIVTGPFEKFTRVTMILPLTGQQYSDKVAENCVAIWKAVGSFTDAEATAVEKFKEAFHDQTFPPGASILFTLSPSGSLTIGFSKDSSVPEQGNAVIENRQVMEAVIESIIGQHGVSPEAKQCLATRVSELLKEFDPVKAQKEG